MMTLNSLVELIESLHDITESFLYEELLKYPIKNDWFKHNIFKCRHLREGEIGNRRFKLYIVKNLQKQDLNFLSFSF